MWKAQTKPFQGNKIINKDNEMSLVRRDIPKTNTGAASGYLTNQKGNFPDFPLVISRISQQSSNIKCLKEGHKRRTNSGDKTPRTQRGVRWDVWGMRMTRYVYGPVTALGVLNSSRMTSGKSSLSQLVAIPHPGSKSWLHTLLVYNLGQITQLIWASVFLFEQTEITMASS